MDNLFNQIATFLNISLSQEITNAFKDPIYLKHKNDFSIRLLSFEEATEVYVDLHENVNISEVFPLWTDDNSNYIAVYMLGPLTGKVCFIDHEEIDLSPVYPSVQTLINTLLESPEIDWYELPKYYPCSKENADERQQDVHTIKELKNLLKQPELTEEKRAHYLFSIMALTPYTHLHEIIPFLEESDMWVQERAAEILGFHRYVPAREKLNWVKEHGQYNGKMAAELALKRIEMELKN
ncbi:TPA: hypothetical protein ACGW7B_001894 [Bacillus nitratireducens]|uniref:hypothetical protein n=1 Tax=Bacillus nitratireducens TaxID=2026193 RepID=UPI0002DE479C|nr:hypothetical protein [Bacillus nitratireducens]PEB82657.1 hypothetical protein COM95_03140 [Bacillus cereus]OJD42449.1 hypothetical protein BAU23_21735 [Bacillus nitratireducens]PFH80632.1 hypothetical protein COI61_04890 [Bacillus cereus]PFN74337.1 hypothetical protein COJ62_12670 [Bacillus cereus]SDZ80645.1 hypothetical protein SAMN04488146_101104 [Bacillus nitratireducens]